MTNPYTLPRTIHKEPYAAIDPFRHELTQEKRTVLITGGSSGIGFAIARAFSKASAARVIITGRRASVVEEAVAKLNREIKSFNSSTIIKGEVCDFSDSGQTEALWSCLNKEEIIIDVLILNASHFADTGKIFDLGVEKVWQDYEANVKSFLQWAERFHRQGNGRKKYLVQTSSVNIHDFQHLGSDRSSYGVSRNSGTLILQQIARDMTSSSMQIISFHPGIVLTEAARSSGFSKNQSIPWDSEDLPAHFAVWAASEEAEFLHGRCVWASWDVEELRNGQIRDHIDNDQHFLKIGVIGW